MIGGLGGCLKGARHINTLTSVTVVSRRIITQLLHNNNKVIFSITQGIKSCLQFCLQQYHTTMWVRKVWEIAPPVPFFIIIPIKLLAVMLQFHHMVAPKHRWSAMLSQNRLSVGLMMPKHAPMHKSTFCTWIFVLFYLFNKLLLLLFVLSYVILLDLYLNIIVFRVIINPDVGARRGFTYFCLIL